MFIRLKDYRMQIDGTDLDKVLSMDAFARERGEDTAESEMKSYMRHRFDVDTIFRDITTFDDTIAYKDTNRVEWTETAWDSSTNYIIGDRVSLSGSIYVAIQASNNVDPTDTNFWTKIGTNEGIYVAVADTIAGDLPNDTAKWLFGDDRNSQLVTFLVDIALFHVHSKNNPRVNPKLRQDRYDNAIKWLVMVQKGNIDLDLPVLLDTEGEKIGGTIEAASDDKIENKY